MSNPILMNIRLTSTSKLVACRCTLIRDHTYETKSRGKFNIDLEACENENSIHMGVRSLRKGGT